MWRMIAMVVVIGFGAPGLASSCVILDPDVVTVRIETCKTVDQFVKEQEWSSLQWVGAWLANLAYDTSGVVLAGTVELVQPVTFYAPGDFEIGPPLQVATAGSWHLVGAGDSCEAFEPGEVHRGYLRKPCCDTYPPEHYACALEIGSLEPVPADVAEQLDGRGASEDDT